MSNLRNTIIELTGLDITTNKALKKYAKSGMSGVLQDIYDVLADVDVDEVNRKAMAVLVGNRRLNGSKMPGVPYFNKWPITAFMENADYRQQAFKEVKPETLYKYRVAIYLIDNEKKQNG